MATITGIDVSSLPSHFTGRVEVDGDCWVWIGARHPKGHGITYLGEQTWDYAHRVAFRHAHGEIPAGHLIHHECHNPSCVRPDHLRGMTYKEHSAEHGLSGAAALHAAATTCAKGHPFDEHNGRQRVCSTCRRERAREWARTQRRLGRQHRRINGTRRWI